MEDQVTLGAGTILEYGDASTHGDSVTWTKLAYMTDITPPSEEAEDIDVSHMESEDRRKQHIAGWSDNGDCELTLQYEKTKTTEVRDLYRQQKGFRITFYDGSKLLFTGYIKTIGHEIDREGIITQPVTIKPSGKMEFEEAA